MIKWGTSENSDSRWLSTFKVFSSFLFWFSLYKIQLVLTKYKRTAEWRCRVVTLIHGIGISCAAIYSQIVEGPDIFNTPPGEGNNDTQMLIIIVCFGYFIFDISWCLYYQTEPAIMLFHHTLSLIGIIFATYAYKWGTELVAVLAATEITNPLLQTRWFLRESGYTNSLITTIVDWTFISLFVLFRLVLGAAFLYVYYTHPKPDFLGRFGAISIFTLNFVFTYYIARYACRKYFSKVRLKAHQNGVIKSSANGHVKLISCNGHAKNN